MKRAQQWSHKSFWEAFTRRLNLPKTELEEIREDDSNISSPMIRSDRALDVETFGVDWAVEIVR